MCDFSLVKMFLLISVISIFLRTTSGGHPHLGKSALEMISLNGYPTETHHITTHDGYILSVYRIPHGLKNSTGRGPPVLLMHGIVQSAADYVLMGPEKSIAFILADLGYDVWLGNARGNLNSKNHTRLDPNQAKFWDFSWHEIGFYDLAAKIDYIIYATGYKKLHYIGHSQGGTAILVLLSSRPMYNAKINLVVLLTPCSYMKNVINPLIYFAGKFRLVNIMKVFQLFTHGELLRHNKHASSVAQVFCSETSLTKEICATLLFLVVGFSYRLMDYRLLPAMLTNSPAGSSYKQVFHYLQSIDSGKFRRFDYGPNQNLRRYGEVSPPDYTMYRVKAPVAIFYSDYDWICCTKDIERLYSELGNPVRLKKITEMIFNHMDFIWSSNDLIQKYIVDIMHKY